MRYYNLKTYKNDRGIFVKTNSKIDKVCKRMANLVKKHAELDKQLVKEFAKTNNISEDEASDIMASYDFMVDASQYGLPEFNLAEITKEEFFKAKGEE